MDLSIAVTERLIALQERFQEVLERDFPGLGMKWVSGENIHLTIKFIGETEDTLIPLMCDRIRVLIRLTPLPPFQVQCVSLGAFPSLEQPRIFWAGLDPQSAEVATLLHRLVERELYNLGIAKEGREFNPHITLGRLKTSKETTKEKVTELGATFHELGANFGRCFIKDMVLYESFLKPDGPIYKVVDRFPLCVN